MNKDIRELADIGRKLLEERGEEFLSTCNVDRDQTLSIVYTSGTTSVSKAVVLSHYNIMYDASGCQSAIDLETKHFNPLPMYHTYSLTIGTLNPLTKGQHLCINGQLKRLLKELQLFQPESFYTVPLILENMLHEMHRYQEKVGSRERIAQAVDKYKKALFIKKPITDKTGLKEIFGSEIKLFLCGGAHLNVSVAEEYQAYGVEVIQGYGITECSPMITNNTRTMNRLGTVGITLLGLSLSFDDGEILVKGPSVFREYYKNPEATTEAFKGEWFRTGDIGYLDKKGYLVISGRKKNLIVFNNGKKVVPEEIESYLYEIPLVKEVIVYGAATGTAMDEVKLSAIVCADPELSQGKTTYEILEELQAEVDRINENLPSYKRINTVTLSEKEFEKNSMKKIQRNKVIQ